MISATDVVADLHRRYDQDAEEPLPGPDDIARWTDNSVEAETTLYNAVGAELARGYSEGRYSFDFCDEVVNGMFGLLMAGHKREPQPAWPQLFFRVYEAFDAGEFHRSDDKSDNPVADHTDPLISTIVNEL